MLEASFFNSVTEGERGREGDAEDHLFRLSENNGELASEQGVAGSRGTVCSTEGVFILPSEGEGDDGEMMFAQLRNFESLNKSPAPRVTLFNRHAF